MQNLTESTRKGKTRIYFTYEWECKDRTPGMKRGINIKGVLLQSPFLHIYAKIYDDCLIPWKSIWKTIHILDLKKKKKEPIGTNGFFNIIFISISIYFPKDHHVT